VAKTDKKQDEEKVIRITLIRSTIGYSKQQRGTIWALGLRRMNQTVEHLESPVLRGMLAKVEHLVQVEE
jgi:large subunit ribosomal protein L30